MSTVTKFSQNFAIIFCIFMQIFSTHNYCLAYKVLIIVPTLSRSQVMFNTKVADVLATHGNNVTILLLKTYADAANGAKPKLAHVKTVDLLTPERVKSVEQIMDSLGNSAFNDINYNAQKISQMIGVYNGYIMEGYRDLITKNDNLIEQLIEAKYDVAISHMYDLCAFGLIHLAEIPAYAWMSSGVLLEYMAWAVGVPWPVSYVPAHMSPYGDRMSYMERVYNLYDILMVHYMTRKNTINPNRQMYWDVFGERGFPDIYEMARRTPLILVNSEEFLDFPRPILHKIVYIGGVGMDEISSLNQAKEKRFDEPLRSLLGKSQSTHGIILISFGTVANTSKIPESWQMALKRTFDHFPETTFIWKYTSTSMQGQQSMFDSVKNLHTFDWIPQVDLLNSGSIGCFITHGGQNSILEAARAGVPLIVVPLFFDQFRNAKAVERHGIGIEIKKHQMTFEMLSQSLNRILTHPEFTRNASRLSKMIRKKPLKPDTLLVNWVQFLAEFHDLEHLAVTDLNLFQYFCLDIILPVMILCLLAIFALFRCCQRFYRYYLVKMTEKREGKKRQ